jgi:hypothetical protein
LLRRRGNAVVAPRPIRARPRAAVDDDSDEAALVELL